MLFVCNIILFPYNEIQQNKCRKDANQTMWMSLNQSCALQCVPFSVLSGTVCKYLSNSFPNASSKHQHIDFWSFWEHVKEPGSKISRWRNLWANHDIFMMPDVLFYFKDTTMIDNSKKRRYLTLEDPDTGRNIRADLRDLRRRCKMEHSWARTIHTFQVNS